MESTIRPDLASGMPAHFKRPAVGNIFEIAGRSILFEANGATVPGLAALLAEYYCKPIPSSLCPAPDATIRWELTDFPKDFGGAFEKFEISGDGLGSTDGRTCVFDFPNARIVVHAGEPRRLDVLTRKALDLESPEDLQVLNYALSTALRRSGLYELHSGAVVHSESRQGVLFAGPSGSGKSTLTLQLVSEGWRYLTDDVVFLKPDHEAVKAYPLRRAFAVTRSTVEAAGKRVGDAFANSKWSNRDKKPFLPSEVFPDTFLPDCEPEAIFFPTITDQDESLVTRLTPSETMIHLIKLCPWSCYDPVTSAGHLRVLSLLAKQCQGFVLLAGKDLLRDPARAAKLVRENLSSRLL